MLPKKKFLFSMQNRLFISYFFLIIIIVGIIGLVTLDISQEIIKEEIGKSKTRNLIQVANDISSLCDALISASNLYSFSDELIKIMSQSTIEDPYERLIKEREVKELFSHYMDAFEKLNLNYFNYYVVVYGYNGYRFTNLNINRPYNFEALLKKEWYSEVVSNNGKITWINTYNDKDGYGEDKYIFTVARLIKHPVKNKPLGIMCINVDEKVLENYYQPLLSNKSEVLIIDSEGKIVSYREKSKLGENILSVDYVKRIIDEKNSGYFTVKEGDVSYLVVYHFIANMNWFIVEVVPLNFVFQPLNYYKFCFLLLLIAGIVAGFIMSYFIARRITSPLKELCNSMEKVGLGDFMVRFSNSNFTEIRQLSEGFNKMVFEISELMKRVRIEEALKRDAEIKFLQSQINPHFIYNTLNSVRCLIAMKQNKQAEDIIITFIRLLRKVLDQRRDLTSLQEELDSLNDYVYIQSIRYGDKFTVKYDIEEKVLNNKVPRLILQPIVENSIFHGIEPKQGRGTITIKAFEKEGELIIQVMDDGVGIDDDRLEELRERIANSSDQDSNHVGLTNVHNRIVYYFGKKYGIDVKSLYGNGTIVTILLPLLYYNVLFCEGRGDCKC